MCIYGVGDLLDEIWLNRVMLLRTVNKMNQEKERHTFSLAAGCFNYLVRAQAILNSRPVGSKNLLEGTP